jgi:hypothetical protein
MAGVCVVAAPVCPREEGAARAIDPAAKRNVEIRNPDFERIQPFIIKSP